jgi:hypothetical protein
LSSVTSGSPHSQEGNLDTEAGPDIADLDGFTEEEFRYDRYTLGYSDYDDFLKMIEVHGYIGVQSYFKGAQA